MNNIYYNLIILCQWFNKYDLGYGLPPRSVVIAFYEYKINDK